MLRRLGRWSYTHRRLVAGAWVLVVVAVAVAAGALSKPTNDAFNVPGTEAQRALDLLDAHFPGAGGATARLVFAAPPGHTLKEARYRSVVDPTVALAQKVPQSAGSGKAFAASVTFSKDDKIAFADLHFLVPVADLKDSTKDALRQVGEPARKAGLEVEFSGGVTSTTSSTSGPVELIGVGVALVILLITFGTFVTALLPLATAVVGVAIGLLAIQALSGITELNSTAPTLATMLGLAVGIDYALFIVSRHREQLAAGAAVDESVARAVGSAGAAVCFAGLTVVIALTGMVIVGIPFLSVMGLAAAGTVLVAVLVAMTLLPALLGFAGARVGGGRHPKAGPSGTLGARWARQVTRRPAIAIGAVIVVLGVIALPLIDLRLGLPDDGSKPAKSTERKAYDLLTQGFGPGFTGPLTVVGDARQVKDPKQVATQAVKALGTFPDVAAVSQPVFNDAGNVAIVTVTPSSGPASERTKDLVNLIRDRAADAERRYGIRGYVTGRTAINIDTSSKISAGLPAFLVVIVGLALVLLMVAFRSVAVPVKAVLGFLLTIASALGIATWTFQQGHLAGLLGIATPSPIVSFLPVLLIAILFGLAMDYEVFLVSRMREQHLRGATPIAAVTGGFTASARVVTAAALIMVSVFAAFVIGDDVVIKSIAFSLAFGVLADAFLVRMTLVPAVLALLGARAWWLPGWLDRHLPHVDIEGGDEAAATATPSPV
ncbi:MAG TPA: MMPL family transporter [Baekduia sp.]|nr:MMPL family transporter [Baekduia sp.]